MSWNTLRNGLVVTLAFFALYVPSSFNGVISREMTIVSLTGTSGMLFLLVVLPRGLGSPLLVLNSLGIMGLLVLFTLTSGLLQFSAGVIFIYLQLAVLYVLNVRSLPPSKFVRAGFVAINLLSIAVGAALALDVKAVDAFVKAFYSAYYPELLSNMLDLFNKPVLTFATHSTAGFMFYLNFYACFAGFRTAGSRFYLGLALCNLALMIAVTSTTGTMFAAIAVFQLVWYFGRRHQWAATPAALGATAAGIVLVLIFEGAASGVAADVRAAIVGDEVRGLAARYARGGLLAGNFAYLSTHPLSPIGFAFSEDLFLGDSGYIVNMLRGSVPLTVMVYGGLLLFLRSNLQSPRAALAIWLAVMAFEVGFAPTQYFRFVGSLPLTLAFLNTLPRPLEPEFQDDRSLGHLMMPSSQQQLTVTRSDVVLFVALAGFFILLILTGAQGSLVSAVVRRGAV
jgi:hypothetical protein